MREKLIELLKEADRKAYEVAESRQLTHPFEVWEIQADHLIANGVTVQKLDGCNYCKSPVYVKTIQYLAPVLAPMTRTEELRQQLYNLTGEVYLELPKQFCPMCGRKLPQPPKGE